MGSFDSDETFYPRTYPNGALEESEHDFLIQMARDCTKLWLPADSIRQPILCVPFWLIEAVWAQIEAGPGSYYKFTFNPPLKVESDVTSLQGV